MKSGVKNIYENKVPVYEIVSGASIAIAAILLIIPGFFSDTIGFLLLIPFTRKILINFFMSRNLKSKPKNKDNETLEGEIIEDKKDEL